MPNEKIPALLGKSQSIASVLLLKQDALAKVLFLMSNLEFGIVLITAPDEQSATTIAAALVERKLAACVNIVPGVRSIYRWQGSVEDSPELLLIAKTIPARFEELKAAVVELHPYETPEAIMLDVAESLEKYARWVVECVE